MVDNQIRPSNVTNRDLLKALSFVQRENFVLLEDTTLSYSDIDLRIEDGRNASNPRLIAKMIDGLKIKKDDIRMQLAKAQNFTCPLSKVKFEIINGRVIDPTTKKAVQVDHDHNTGFVRGVLIQKINWLVDQWQQGSWQTCI